MKLFQRILSGLSFFLLVMLLFLLLFQDKVSLPPFLETLGRMHPLVLHLPIGLLAIIFIIWLSRKNFDKESFQKIFVLILKVTVFNAVLTALFGFFLSREGGYDNELLSQHKFFGVITALLSYVLLWIYQSAWIKKKVFAFTLFTTMIIMIIGSYFGADLTHGEGFVFQPMMEDEQEIKITDSSTVYVAAVRPILDRKCFSCHNERKAKGELVMTSEEKIMKGGKHGPIWESGDALNSHIIQKINLPEEDKKHMPPAGKPQLTQEEIDFLFTWINAGADMKKKINELAENDPMKEMARKFIPDTKDVEEPHYLFAAASGAVIEKIINPFCNLFPIAQHSPALQADFFVRERFDNKKLQDLTAVKEQLVVLNLNNMPVTDEDMKTIVQFSNLEKLILNNASISNEGLKDISKLKKLKSLSLAGTSIDKRGITYLSGADSLAKVFIWNTKISLKEAKELQKQFSKIELNTGYLPPENEILKLTPPVVQNEEFLLAEKEKIGLKHQIKGVIIHYTTDGSDPDSVSAAVYSDPLDANGFTIIKARAVKQGWYSSPVVTYTFFKKGFTPDSVELLNQPNEKYKGSGGNGLIDLKKGTAENYSDPAWIAYREKPFEAIFYFNTKRNINSINISYNKNIPSYLLPPETIEVWAGDEKNNLKLLKKIRPVQPGKEEGGVIRIEGIKVEIPVTAFRVYKLRASPLSKLPVWHPGKGDQAWIFIDEIFFN